MVPVKDKMLMQPIKDIEELTNESLHLHGMAACHSISIIEERLQGDPLDVKVLNSNASSFRTYNG